jgi:hypothetical protein
MRIEAWCWCCVFTQESTKNAAKADRSEVKDVMVNYAKDLFQSLRSLQMVNSSIVADIVTITRAFEEAIIEKIQTTLKARSNTAFRTSHAI